MEEWWQGKKIARLWIAILISFFFITGLLWHLRISAVFKIQILRGIKFSENFQHNIRRPTQKNSKNYSPQHVFLYIYWNVIRQRKNTAPTNAFIL